jgi:hypothetical protein
MSNTIMTTAINNLPINIGENENIGDIQDPLVKEVLNNMEKNKKNIEVLQPNLEYYKYPQQIIKNENIIDYNLLIISILMLIIVYLTLNSQIVNSILISLSNDFLISNEIYVKYILILISFYLLQKNK